MNLKRRSKLFRLIWGGLVFVVIVGLAILIAFYTVVDWRGNRAWFRVDSDHACEPA